VMNGEDLGHKGRLQAFSKRKVRLQEKWGYLYAKFRVSALPGQIRCDRSHWMRSITFVHEFRHLMGISTFKRTQCIRTQGLQN
jgi:hypothetical protein